MKKLSVLLLGIFATAAAVTSHAESESSQYIIDQEDAHAFIQFRVKHLGFSWLYGRFNDFSGDFTFDEKDPSKNQVNVEVDVTSLDSNHTLRDRHLRSDDFLNTEKFPKATFVSTSYKATEGSKAELVGDLTLLGVTKPITIQVEHIGGGTDPWGGHRHGFEGRATIKPADWGIAMVEQLGPEAEQVELMLSVEGIRQDSE